MTAGLGTRLRPFTEVVPKPLLPVMGIPVAQYGVDLLSATGVADVVANIHHLPEKATSGLKALDWGGARLHISDETSQILGSGGGLKKAQPLLSPDQKSPFYVLNADVLCDIDLLALRYRHEQLKRQWGVKLTLALNPVSPPGEKYREILVKDGLITGLGEIRERCPFYIGAAVLEPGALASLPPTGPSEFVTQMLLPAIQSGMAGAYLNSGEWFDVGSPQSWLNTHLSLIEMLELGKISQKWRRRIESVNSRVQPRVWLNKKTSRRSYVENWVGPAYASPTSRWSPPQNLGPRSVLYGEGPQEMKQFSDGIAYDGQWVSVQR